MLRLRLALAVYLSQKPTLYLLLQPYLERLFDLNVEIVGLSYRGSRISFIPALQMLIFTASELQIRKNGYG